MVNASTSLLLHCSTRIILLYMSCLSTNNLTLENFVFNQKIKTLILIKLLYTFMQQFMQNHQGKNCHVSEYVDQRCMYYTCLI